ncbi:ABC transporter permease [Aquisediminimonas sediminicola]|uniref:ABC transporter permease n=1 Tax=Alteraquisediminimonas sediminicola TaxID=2676787 RepID=UPI001C8D4736|nr:SMP-30/gluconolactonase/LRE family protein [Aquisediminimonas sediminicola]
MTTSAGTTRSNQDIRSGWADSYAHWRYRLVPDHIVGEILSKNWIDNAIPVLTLVISLIAFSSLIPNMLSLSSVSDISHTSGEYLLVGLGMTIVVLAGGIDLSIGSIFALSNLLVLACGGFLGLPLWLSILIAIASGGIIGAVNGLLIGFLRLRAFLTTLVTMIVVRGIVDTLQLRYSTELSSFEIGSATWDFVAFYTFKGMSISFIVALFLTVLAHLFLTRLRLGWHILAVGGSRRAAFNAGIDVRRTVFITYVLSGMLAALAGVFYAARLSSLGSDTGVGLEIAIITAVVLGGTALGGGRGSVFKTLLGVIIVVVITNSLVRLGLRSGASPLVLGLMLLTAVAIDVRWLKNRHKAAQKSYVAPVFFALPAMQSCAPGTASPYAINTALGAAEPIGLGDVDAPEDVVLDRDDNLYCGSRDGDVLRFFPPDYKRYEVFAHIGGSVLGLAIDRAGNLLACVGGMGLYQISPDREITKLSDETNRSLLSVIDDSRLRLADDLDIAPDGKVYFSEATIRYDMHDWIVDALEGRGNGRIIRYDPSDGSSRTIIRNLQFPNGICMAMDGESFLFAETWGCRISRHWFAGPRKGKTECVIPDLPGYPDNINLASDGNFWCGMIGMRTPAFDLAQRMPGFRRRMVMRIARDEWLYPNMNTGGVIKFNLQGEVLGSLWDQEGERHPQVTSMREHKGYLYLGGIFNNRIGRIHLPDADPEWTGPTTYWGEKS